MAVTVEQLRDALRVGDTTEETAEVTRLLATATALVEDKAPTAPEGLRDEAAIRIAAHLYDKPNYEPGAGYAQLFRNSGAGDLLSRWIVVRSATAVQAPATASPGGAGVDQTARDAAAAAQATADANKAKLMPPNNAEADAATSTTIRGWTAALIRRVVESVVPSWARRPNAPAGAGGGTDQTARDGVSYLQGRVKRLDDLTVDIEDDVANRVYQPASVATEGGMEEVSDFPADVAAAVSDFGAANGTNSIALADQATVKIVFRIPKDASRTAYQVDAAGSLQVSSVDPVGGFGANVSGTWKYYQITAKNVSGASTDVRLLVHDDVYRWRGKTLWNQVEGQEIDHRLDSLDNATSDLHAGSPATGWSDISSASQGGIREGAGGAQWTLTTARAVGNSDWRLSLNEAQAMGNYGLIRIPAAADARSYRLEFTASADLGGTVSYGDLSHWTRLGESSDGNWQYYDGPGTFAGDARVVLQATGSAAHHGTSRFDGGLSVAKILEALGLAALGSGNRNKFLKRKSDDTGFDYVDAPTGDGSSSGGGLGAPTAIHGAKSVSTTPVSLTSGEVAAFDAAITAGKLLVCTAFGFNTSEGTMRPAIAELQFPDAGGTDRQVLFNLADSGYSGLDHVVYVLKHASDGTKTATVQANRAGFSVSFWSI